MRQLLEDVEDVEVMEDVEVNISTEKPVLAWPGGGAVQCSLAAWSSSVVLLSWPG